MRLSVNLQPIFVLESMGIDAGAVIFVLERVTGSLAASDNPKRQKKTGWGAFIDSKFGTLAQSPTHARVRRAGLGRIRRASGHVTLAIW